MISKFRPAIELSSAHHKLDPRLVEAMVWQESGDFQYAYNPEPRYQYFWDVKRNKPFRRVSGAELEAKYPPSDFPCLRGDPDQEWWSQQASHGVLQLMGALARELGFVGPYLPEINDVHLNLDLGCRHFAKLLRWAKGDEWQAVAAYNGGKGNWKGAAPQKHVTKVKGFYRSLT